ncbi:MAG: hypothetical protein FK734_15080 [Asgard group archaeon]|nr:hypothetical protein [Asgard group archaeon]
MGYHIIISKAKAGFLLTIFVSILFLVNSFDYTKQSIDNQNQIETQAEIYNILGNWTENLGQIDNLYVANETLYVVNDGVIIVYDIANLNNPILLNTYNSVELNSYNTAFLVINNSIIVQASADDGFEIINCSDVNSISLLYWYTSGQHISDVAYHNSYLYVVDYYTNLMIFDMSDLSNIDLVNSTTISGVPYKIKIKNDCAFIASSTDGIRIFNLSIPTAPKEISYYSDGDDYYNLAIENDRLYTFSTNNTDQFMSIIDISDIYNPINLVEYPNYYLNDIVVKDSIVYIGKGFYGLMILNCTDHSNIYTLVAYSPQLYIITNIFVEGNYLFTSSFYDGVDIYSIDSLPYLPHVKDIGGGLTADIVVDGDLAFIADYTGGIVILDISNTLEITKISEFNPGGITRSLYLKDNFLYVANSNLGMIILDVSNPALPINRGYFYCDCYDIVVRDSMAYITAGSEGFFIVDVSDPAHLTETLADMPSYSQLFFKIEISGNLAYVATDYELLIYSIAETDGYEIGELVSHYFSSSIQDFVIIGDYVYIAKYGIMVISVSNPEDPILVSSYTTNSYNIIINFDNYLLVSSNYVELTLIEITSPDILIEILTITTSGGLNALYYYKGGIFLGLTSCNPDFQIITFDRDQDGLSDYEEETIYHTDPTNPDTDGDGLNDFDEVMLYNTDPLDEDSDDDKLSDYEEVMLYGTDPNNWDTDGDGYSDWQEIRRGSDPLDPNSIPSFRYWLLFTGLFASLAFVALVTFLGIVSYRKLKERKAIFGERKDQDTKANELKLFRYLLSLDEGSKITIQQLADNLAIDVDEISKTLAFWDSINELNYLGSFDSLKGIFTKKGFKIKDRKKFPCYYCSHECSSSESICTNCDFEIPICPCCDKPIIYDDILAYCPKCSAQAHASHLVQYIKTHQHCPKCNAILKIEDIKIQFDKKMSRINSEEE